MLQTTLSAIKQNSFETNEIIQIVNENKKEEIGYLIPTSLKNDFEIFLKNREKIKLLKKIAKAQKEDFIGDGTVSDGIF